MNSLNSVVKIISELQAVSSTKAKEHIIRKNSDNETFKQILWYTYNPNLKYGVSENFLNKLEFDPEDCESDNLYDLLDTLAKSNINDELRNRVRKFINYFADEQVRDLIKRVLGKNLKCNINIKMINKVFKNLIPTSDTTRKIAPMLGSKVELDKFPSGTKYVSEKYDGCRCLAFIENGTIEMYTRQGKIIEGCKEIEEELLSLGINNVMLDGEILATDCTYDNVYKETTKRLKNKKEIKDGLYYMIFDYIEKNEYDKLQGIYSYEERRNKLNMIKEKEHIKVAPLLLSTDDMNEVLDLLDKYRHKGAEGCMVNYNKPYEFKRSKTLLKLKVMQTIDLKVIGFEEGTNKNKGKLGAVLVKYKGNVVKVGSGWSDNQREEVWDNQEFYLGKILEIAYFEETTNKDNTFSLRFPIAKCWRLDKDEESYN